MIIINQCACYYLTFASMLLIAIRNFINRNFYHREVELNATI